MITLFRQEDGHLALLRCLKVFSYWVLFSVGLQPRSGCDVIPHEEVHIWSCLQSDVIPHEEAGLDWDQKMALAFLAMAAHYDYLYDMRRHTTYQRIYPHIVLFQQLK